MNSSPYTRKYDVSVIIACFNQERILRLSLEALMRQDFVGSYEIIICDDGSSIGLLRSFCDIFNKAKIPIRYVWHQDRSNRANQSRNNGIKLSQGKVLLFLDGDIIPTFDLVRKHVELQSGEKRMIAGNRLWVYPEEVNIENLSAEEALSLFTKYAVARKDVNKKQIKWSQSDKPWKACFGCHLSVWWSPEVHFDETLIGWGVEDWEMACRLYTKHGYLPIYRDEIVVYHYEIPELVASVYKRSNHDEIVKWLRNVTYFVDKYPELNLQELFEGFQRFKLDSKTNLWSLRETKPTSYDLKQIVADVREWLAKNKIYP